MKTDKKVETLYNGKPLILPESQSRDFVITSEEGKYEPGVITISGFFVGDKDSAVEIDINRDIIKSLAAKYCNS